MPDLTIYSWALGGDPTSLGWVICIAYLITSWSCFKKGKQLSDSRASMRFWYGLAFLMLFLGINKQLDLQTILAGLIRQVAITDGWYAYRRHMQHAFIISLPLLFGCLLVFYRFLLVEVWHRFKLAWLGVFVLFSFVLLRAAAFNHEAKVLLDSVDGYYQLLELAGIVLIFVACKLANKSDIPFCDVTTLLVYIYSDGEAAKCPKCGAEAQSAAVHSRKFKCKQCGSRYQTLIS